MSETPLAPQVTKVLVIDDDPSLLTTLSESLDILGGFQVATATDGAQGLEQVEIVQPDCIIVDIRMPGLNGYQFVRALRGDSATAAISIIVLSALVQDNEQFAGMLTGADAYLLKPVKIADLVSQITHLMWIPPATRAARRRLALDPTIPDGPDGQE